MTDEEIGRLSQVELLRLSTKTTEIYDEIRQRFGACYDGKPGVSPLLSRRVVREMRGLLMPTDEPHLQPTPYNDGVKAAARWLLALDSDAPSPLDES